MRQKVTQTKKTRKKFIMAAILIMAVATVAGIFTYRHYHKSKQAQTTSKSETAQSNYSGGAKRPTDVASGGNQGGAKDNNGKAPDTDNQPVPTTTSSGGAITVNGLASNSSLKSGDSLYGTTTVSGPVSFRVIDETDGVVAQGQLNVVNGSFSGKLSFTARSTTGRLDVYTTDSMGSEINNIEIPVQFK